ncbi:MAG: response regulator [Synergistaceae bacterium]|nr:response regulator [Synergistaceae bacterium]
MERSKYSIILAVNNMAILDYGREILKTSYDVYPALSAVKFFEILKHVIPDLILLDVEMPDMSGNEIIKKLKSDVRLSEIPVVFIAVNRDENSEKKGFDLGAADYIYKPFSAPLLTKTVETQLKIVQKTKDLMAIQTALKNYESNLEKMVLNKTKEVISLHAVLTAVAELIESRDKYTSGHVSRTRLYLKAMIEEMLRKEIYKEEISKWNLDYFLTSSQLHDLGKIIIPEQILNKPSKLTSEEFGIMKKHVSVRVSTIEKILNNTYGHGFLHHVVLITETHHEKWDGSGYPAGLKGNDIPLEGRLMAISDSYDALISERPYKKAFSRIEAKKIIENNAGIQFDPQLVNVFRSVTDNHEF